VQNIGHFNLRFGGESVAHLNRMFGWGDDFLTRVANHCFLCEGDGRVDNWNHG
jgi:hypothetical protein